jgi:hypothetical protein
VGSSSVVGGEGAWWAAEEGAEVDAEGEGEEALGDAGDEAGERLGEVSLEAHLAFEVGEHRLDHEPDAGLGDLGGWSVAGVVFGGG